MDTFRSIWPSKKMTTRGKWLTAAGVIVLLLYFAGALDVPASKVGLNTRTCVDRLIGGTLCGDQAVTFCKENYSPEINSEPCDDILREEGVDVEAIAAKAKADEKAAQAKIMQDAEEEAEAITKKADDEARAENNVNSMTERQADQLTVGDSTLDEVQTAIGEPEDSDESDYGDGTAQTCLTYNKYVDMDQPVEGGSYLLCFDGSGTLVSKDEY